MLGRLDINNKQIKICQPAWGNKGVTHEMILESMVY